GGGGRGVGGAEHEAGAVVPRAAKDIGCRQTCRATTHDGDRVGPGAALVSRRAFRRRSRQLFAHEYQFALLLYPPAWKGIESRGTDRFSRSEAETGGVPGTPDRLVDDRPPSERSMVMRTVRTNCEQLGATPDNEDLIVADISLQDVVVEFPKRNPCRQVSRVARFRHHGDFCRATNQMQGRHCRSVRGAPPHETNGRRRPARQWAGTASGVWLAWRQRLPGSERGVVGPGNGSSMTRGRAQ